MLACYYAAMATFEVIPAIDVLEGRCVRLSEGRREHVTIEGGDAAEAAALFAAEGATRLHLVDLNGAFAGTPVNGAAVTAIAKQFPQLPIQIGGGIRTAATIEHYLQAGVSYVIIGTKAVKEPAFVGEVCRLFPGRIIVGNAGTLVTRTLLIAGEAGFFTTPSGDRGAMLRAYDKATGKEAGAVYMPAPQTGSPMTYELAGEQYLVVAISGGNYSGELIAFKPPSPRAPATASPVAAAAPRRYDAPSSASR